MAGGEREEKEKKGREMEKEKENERERAGLARDIKRYFLMSWKHRETEA